MTASVLFVFATLAAVPQLPDREMLVDFGTTSLLSAGGVPAWNDIPFGTLDAAHQLVDTTGASSGVTLQFDQMKPIQGANASGTVVPTLGSALELLGWPTTAISDTFFGDSTQPELEFWITGLDPSASYDLTVVASFLGGGGQRVAWYEALGFNRVGKALNASNNSSDLVVLDGVVPEPGGRIKVFVRADELNTNPGGAYHLGALGIAEFSGGAAAPQLGFSRHDPVVSRIRRTGTYTAPLTVSTSSGATPIVTMSAVDDATGLPPTWLQFPELVTAGTVFTIPIEINALALGTHRAQLNAEVFGYTPTRETLTVNVRDSGELMTIVFGNSYLRSNGGVAAILQEVASEHGFVRPNPITRYVSGATLDYHVTDPFQVEAISNELPIGAEWDVVVVLGGAGEATSQLGDPAKFTTNALQMAANVRAASPSARTVLVQPWVVGGGHATYQGPSPPYPGPLQMHLDADATYEATRDAIAATYGASSVAHASPGDTVFLHAFDPAIYQPDFSHPTAELSVMTTLTVFTALYGVLACEVEPDFSSQSPLATRLFGFGIDGELFAELAGIADRTADPQVRYFSGSGDDYLLLSGVADLRNACPIVEVSPGESVGFDLSSPNGLVNGTSSFLYADFSSVAPPWLGDPGFPELRFAWSTSSVLFSTGTLTPGGHAGTWVVPPSLGGRRILVQGYVMSPSTKTGNPFTTTDAHELRIQGVPLHKRLQSKPTSPRR